MEEFTHSNILIGLHVMFVEMVVSHISKLVFLRSPLSAPALTAVNNQELFFAP